MKTSQESRCLVNSIRAHRRRAGLTQRELSDVLGYPSEYSVWRHEHLSHSPTLRIAIAYEIVFQVPLSEIFAGLREDVSAEVEPKLLELEERLGQRSATDRYALATARKLMWLSSRRNPDLEEVL